MTSSASAMPPSSSSFSLPVAVGPLEGAGPSSSSCSSSLRPSPPLRPRGRRPLRILYPPSLSRRPPPLREAPDAARRWLLLLSALLFLQIYTEEPHCTELQSSSPDSAASQPQEAEGSLGTTQGWAVAEEPWRVQAVGGASGTQLECVVA